LLLDTSINRDKAHGTCTICMVWPERKKKRAEAP
jgi:hypothetical protein